MKYILGTSLLALTLAACTSAPTENMVESKPADMTTAATQVVNFTGPMDLTLTLKSTDNFETAMLTDNADRTFMLKRAPAASGVYMTDGKGVSIHFKAGEGIVEFVKNKPISIKEFKH